MSNPFEYFVPFLWGALSHVVTLLAGCVVTVVIGLLERHAFKRSISWRWEIAILLFFVFFACFQTWRDEYRAPVEFEFVNNDDEYVKPPEKRPYPNYAILIKVSSKDTYTHPCIIATSIIKRGDPSWPAISVPTKIGWYRDRDSFDCAANNVLGYFVIFHATPKDGKHLRLFLNDKKCEDNPLRPCIAPELVPATDFVSGDYEITVVVVGDNQVSKPKHLLVHWDGDIKTFRMEIAD